MKLTEILNTALSESDASDEAQKKGLVSKGWGRWYDADGNFVAQTVDGKLKYIFKKEPTHSNDMNGATDLVKNQEKYINKAATLAIQAHGDQKYGNHPYSYHLKKVYNNAVQFGGTVVSKLAAILHDTLEDTQLPKQELEKAFGPKVAHVVDLLTNRPSKEETYKRIRTDPEAVFVKLCDRLANVTEGQKNDKYRNEQHLFKSILYRPGEYESLWHAIDKALAK